MTKFNYYFQEKNNIIWYCKKEIQNKPDLLFIGESDNPNKAMAAGIFMQKIGKTSGYSLKHMVTTKSDLKKES